jgi:GTP-binding protein HflX
MFHENICIPPQLGRLQGALYRLNAVQTENFDELGNWLLDVRLPMSDWQRLKKEFGEQIEELVV